MIRPLRVALACGLLAAHTPAARAQANLQLWGNATIDWTKSARLTYELDFEPKALVKAPEGDPAWRNLDVTPNVEYALNDWQGISSTSAPAAARRPMYGSGIASSCSCRSTEQT